MVCSRSCSMIDFTMIGRCHPAEKSSTPYKMVCALDKDKSHVPRTIPHLTDEISLELRCDWPGCFLALDKTWLEWSVYQLQKRKDPWPSTIGVLGSDVVYSIRVVLNVSNSSACTGLIRTHANLMPSASKDPYR